MLTEGLKMWWVRLLIQTCSSLLAFLIWIPDSSLLLRSSEVSKALFLYFPMREDISPRHKTNDFLPFSHNNVVNLCCLHSAFVQKNLGDAFAIRDCDWLIESQRSVLIGWIRKGKIRAAAKRGEEEKWKRVGESYCVKSTEYNIVLLPIFRSKYKSLHVILKVKLQNCAVVRSNSFIPSSNSTGPVGWDPWRGIGGYS